MRKPVFGVSDQINTNRSVQPKTMASDLESREIIGKTKALISCAVMRLCFRIIICKSRFNHDKTQLKFILRFSLKSRSVVKMNKQLYLNYQNT